LPCPCRMVVAKKYSKQIISCTSEENRKIQINHWFGCLQVLYLAILATFKTSIFSHCRWHAASVIMDVALLYSLNFLLCFALCMQVCFLLHLPELCVRKNHPVFMLLLSILLSLWFYVCVSQDYTTVLLSVLLWFLQGTE
jgi:hypothetical protein